MDALLSEVRNGTDVRSLLASFFNLLTDDEVKLVMDNSELRCLSKNEEVYGEGDKPKEFLCLLKGEVKISKKGLANRRQIVRMIRPVGFFGYRAFFAEECYITSAKSIGYSEVLAIPNRIMRAILSKNNKLVLRFLQVMAAELGFSDERAISLTQKHVPGRLAESILVLEGLYGVEEDGATLSIYMSREDLADFSNMTPSNCIRTLSAFVSEKLIALDGRKIKILSKEGLENISRLG